MGKYLEAGKIVNTHGIKGEVRIQPWVDSADFLKQYKQLYIDGAAYKVASARVHKACLITLFEGVDDINRAMVLKNKTVCIDKAEVKLPDGHFFIEDILGASVIDEAGAVLGELTDVIEAPSANVYVVTGEREILIPALPQFIIRTDVPGRVITVRLIDGM